MEVKTEEKIKIIPKGAPYLAIGIIWFILAMIFPIYKMSWVIIVTLIAMAAGIVLSAKRKKQIESMPVVTPIKARAEALAKSLDEGRDKLNALCTGIKNQKVASIVSSMAITMEKLADNLEANPKDRNKIRKVALHYVPMVVDLVEKYINLENQNTDGQNITASMIKIEEGLGKVDISLKQYLDDMFEDDKIDIVTDIEVLKQLLNKDATSVNKLNFDDILKEENGGN